MKNVFVCIPLKANSAVEIQPMCYDYKKDVVALYRKFEKELKVDLSGPIQYVYSNKPAISLIDTNNDNKPEYIFYYTPESTEEQVWEAVEKIASTACKGSYLR